MNTSGKATQAGLNRNLLLNLLVSSCQGVADSIWLGTMLVAFLSELTNNSNTKVGLVTAAQGAAQLLTAIPAGWAADRYPRSRVIAVGGVGLLLAVAIVAYSVVSSKQDSSDFAFWVMCGGLGVSTVQATVN